METIDRYRGAMLGLAAGDALGTTLEFTTPGNFTPITDMVDGGPFHLKPGQWTDDTSMALCLAESLLECGSFDPVDQLVRYVRWKRTGHHSSTGACFDIGGTVLKALARFERFSEPWSGGTDTYSAGNGSMRLAPVPLFFAHDAELAISNAALSSRTTHGHPEAIDACRYLAALIVGALQGRTKEKLLLTRFSPLPGLWTAHPLVAPIARVANGSFRQEETSDVAVSPMTASVCASSASRLEVSPSKHWAQPVLHGEVRGGDSAPDRVGRLERTSEVVDGAITARLKEHAWKAIRASGTE